MRPSPIVLTLDAGGTNFVFSAISQAKEITTPISIPSHGEHLDRCLQNIVHGFQTVIANIGQQPDAISFAFPGPADYRAGVIGDLGNLPAFRGGVPLGPILSKKFNVPVFINNDGDLFALGEAKYGFLPFINQKLNQIGIAKQYRNLFGVTLGTGFGGGFCIDGQLFSGDNGAGAEIWLMRNPFHSEMFAEESISARAIVREYETEAKLQNTQLTPYDIFLIAQKQQPGDAKAAQVSFAKFGQALGEVLGDIITITDSSVVIGGGLAKAYPLFAMEMFKHLRRNHRNYSNQQVTRLEVEAYDAENEQDWHRLANIGESEITIPETTETIKWESQKRVFVGLTKLETSKAIALGAYEFAVSKIK